MFWLGRERRTYLDGERVACPVRGGDADLLACMACEKLRCLIDDDRPYVVCEAWRDRARTADATL